MLLPNVMPSYCLFDIPWCKISFAGYTRQHTHMDFHKKYLTCCKSNICCECLLPHSPMMCNMVNFVNNVRIIVIQSNWMLHWAMLNTSVANLKCHYCNWQLQRLFSNNLWLLHLIWIKRTVFAYPSSAFVYLRGNCTCFQLDNIVNRIHHAFSFKMRYRNLGPRWVQPTR